MSGCAHSAGFVRGVSPPQDLPVSFTNGTNSLDGERMEYPYIRSNMMVKKGYGYVE